MKIRSITLFDRLTPEIDADHLDRLGTFASLAREAYQAGGFEVQTVRLATDVFPALAQSAWADRLADFAVTLEQACLSRGFEYVALGPAGKAQLGQVPALLEATRSAFVTVRLVGGEDRAIDGEAVRGAAQVIAAASRIKEGFGNLRFAALANVPPGTPFFPAAYHDGGEPAFAIATQAANLAVDACNGAHDAEEVRRRLAIAIEAEGARLAAVAREIREQGFRFGGIDFSLAPFPEPEISIGAALETLTGQPLGCSGTLAAAALLADAVEQARYPHTGFCGLMLPVLEDPVLAGRAAEGSLRVGELLQWSAVCGTGLDTVPLPGNADQRALARLLFDVAGLSVRLGKPLTARLMPLPGKAAGDPVHFDFAYFSDGGVLALGGDDRDGLIGRTTALTLHARGANR